MPVVEFGWDKQTNSKKNEGGTKVSLLCPGTWLWRQEEDGDYGILEGKNGSWLSQGREQS